MRKPCPRCGARNMIRENGSAQEHTIKGGDEWCDPRWETPGANLAEACHWCGRTGYGRECPPCEVKHEGEPLPSEADASGGAP